MSRSTLTIDGRFLVHGSSSSIAAGPSPQTTRNQNATAATAPPPPPGQAPPGQFRPLLVSHVPLSFWGGLDPVTGIVTDASHPLVGQCVSGTVLCLPSGRGSCTASQVLLELVLRGTAPAALVMRDPDGLACVGALVAQEIVCRADAAENSPPNAITVPAILDILCIGEQGYAQLLLAIGASKDGAAGSAKGRVLPNGQMQLALDANESSYFDQSATTENVNVGTTITTTTTTYSNEEERLLDACTTDAERMALNVIFRYAKISSGNNKNRNETATATTQQQQYVPIAQAHIDGCTYIGPGGLEFVRRLVAAGGTVKVPTTLNSVSADRRGWQALGVPEEYARNSIALGDAYLELGCQPSFTCAPYLLEQTAPTAGQDIAWGESNAVVYANSVVGARTEKYADYLDICCAIAGIVPAAGVHLTANRRPRIVLDGSAVFADLFARLIVKADDDDDDDDDCDLDLDLLFPTLGHLCGTLSDGRVPILTGLEDWNISTDHLKAFCAAFGTTASSPLIHIAGITPEAKDPATMYEFVTALCDDNQVRTISMQDLEETFQLLDANTAADGTNNNKNESIDLVALGNPHLSVSECRDLAQLILRAQDDGRSSSNGGVGAAAAAAAAKINRPSTRIIACMSRAVHAQADAAGHVRHMRDFGVEFVFDTCWCMLLDEPVIPTNKAATILTNSGKYAHYGPGLTNRKFRFGSMSDCIQAAQTGVYPRRRGTARTANESPTGGTLLSSSSFLTRQRRQFTATTTALRSVRSLLRRWR